MKAEYRQSRHKEYVGDKYGNLYFNQLKYFEFHSYPGIEFHKLWCVGILLMLLFKLDNLFELSAFSGIGGLYVFYLTSMTLYLLLKKICRNKGYFLYPNFMIQFFKKRRKSKESATQVA